MTDLITYGAAPEQGYYRHIWYDPKGLITGTYETPNNLSVGPDVQVSRSYDAYSQINFEGHEIDYPYGGGSVFQLVYQSWDSAGRRVNLQTGANMNFGYQADGLMTQAGNSSFTYANNGLPASRASGAKIVTVNQRDGRGRVLQATTALYSSAILTETLSWRNDGRLSGYTANRDFTDSRNYSYSSLANRVTQESFGLSSGNSATNNYTIDNGAAGGLGILTSATESGSVSASWSVPATNGLDGLSRVAQAQDSLIRRSAIGTANGAGAVSATLDGNPLDVQFDGNSVTNDSGFWRVDLDLSPGAHTLAVSAVDPSGHIFGSTNSTFYAATNAGDNIQNTYDGNGNVTKRIWVNTLNQTNRTQTLTWDAFDRLIDVTQRDTNGNGFNWTACYDSFGRRIETTCDMVLTNTAVTGPLATASTIDSWYDPQVEFEEIGVQVNGLGYWKTVGPDVNGVYGGMQGMGGTESILEDGHFSSTGVVQDFFGNVVATIAGGSLQWNSNRFSSYGPVPGYQSLALSPEVSLAQSLGWRGKRVDETGLICLGARHYDSVAGRFLNADPLGHSASMDLYSFAGGDPVNFFDPSGRAVIQSWQQAQQNLITRGGFWNNVGAYGISFGLTAFNAFSFGSFAKNDALVDQNLAGNISDRQFWSGAVANSGIAATKLAVSVGGGYLASAGSASFLGSVGAPTLVTTVGSGITGGVAADFGVQTVGIAAGDQNGYNLTELSLSGAVGGGLNFGANYIQSPRLLLGQLGNAEVGQLGEQQAAQEIANSGQQIAGQQLRFQTPDGNPRVDFAVLDPDSPSGYTLIEIKTGSAELTDAQAGGYPQIEAGNGIPTGSASAAAGLPVGQTLAPTPIQIWNYQPYDLLPFNIGNGGALGAFGVGTSASANSYIQQDATGKNVKHPQ